MSSGTLARREPQAGGLAAQLREAMPRLAATLPAHFTPEKMIQLLNVVIFKTPDLQKCSAESVITAAVQAGSLDLDLNPGMNEAFLIPRGGVANFQPGYKGLEKLAIRTGAVRFIQPREVCENDTFRVRHDPDTTVFHEIDYKRPRGEVTHIYAVAELAHGKQIVEVMSRDEIEGVRRRSQMPNAGPWRNDWKEMGCKTLVKRICKRLPRTGAADASPAFERLNAAIEADNREYEGWEERPEHHAVHLDNRTGHGRTGAYAPPEAVAEYLAWAKQFAASRNAEWVDRWTKWVADSAAESRPGVQDLLSVTDLHLAVIGWGESMGLLLAPKTPRVDQLPKLAAVAWLRNQGGTVEAATRFARSRWREAKAAMEAAEGDPEPVPAEDQTQDDGDPDCDLAIPGEREPGSDG